MEPNRLAQLSDEELLLEKKKLKKSKLFHAGLIGFLIGVIGFGLVAWIMNPDRKFGFIIPMLFPIYFIYKLVKSPNKHEELENILKERNL